MNLQELADRQEIAGLLYRYCRAVDRIDEALGHTVWHEDGTADYGDYYRGPGRGVIDLICGHHRSTLAHSHQMTNILIDLDGDHAGSESYCFATLRIARGEKLMQVSVWTRYIDRWSRRNERWGLDRRQAIRDLDDIREAAPLSAPTAGRRDRTDPSYSVLSPPT